MKFEIENSEAELTLRELKVLELLIIGYGNNQIAKELFISTHTVKFYVSSIIKKLNAKNRTHAAYIAFKQNLIK